MTKIKGGVPGGWHGGQLPGASAPFRFQFDANGVAEVEEEIAKYVTSVPGPFAIVEEEEKAEDAPASDDVETPSESEITDESQDGPDTTSDKTKRSRRKKALDE